MINYDSVKLKVWEELQVRVKEQSKNCYDMIERYPLEYHQWKLLLQKCYNPNHPEYAEFQHMIGLPWTESFFSYLVDHNVIGFRAFVQSSSELLSRVPAKARAQ